MAGPVILAIDEGTTNAKAIAVDRAGQVAARGNCGLTLHHPQPGLAEQDAEAIWQAVKQAAERCLAGCAGSEVAAVA
ncbi:FGGY family carbohydrate kinase, partial [Pantoea sp.]